jgi:hypothetical protein
MNEKIKAHLVTSLKEMCKDDDFAMVSALAVIGCIVCFLGYMFMARAFGYGVIGIAILYGSVISWMVLAEIIKAYGESND